MRVRVLIVDDELVQVESLQVYLEAAGYAAETGLTTQTACQLAETHPPQAMILDWRLRDGGVAFIEKIRDLAGRPEMPVIVVTGLPLEKISGLDGMTNVTLREKPYDVEELVQLLPPTK